jgi:hypothetical protein
MFNLSRRSLVASAAALPALTVPAVASALPTGADVELQQLGVRLLGINRRISNLEAGGPHTDEEFERVLAERIAVVPKILAHTATTIDGLAVQVVACISGCQEVWESEGGDGAMDTERPFIEAVARYAGVRHPARNVRPWSPSSDAYKPEPDLIFAALKAFDAAVEVENAGYEARNEDAADKAFEQRWSAMLNVVETVPTTLAGMRAKIEFATSVDYVFEALVDDEERVHAFLDTLYRSAAVIAGLPAPAPTPWEGDDDEEEA